MRGMVFSEVRNLPAAGAGVGAAYCCSAYAYLVQYRATTQAPQPVRISDHTQKGADHATRVRARPAWCKIRTPEAEDKQVLVERCIRSWGCPGTAAGRSSASTGLRGSSHRTCPPRPALECEQVGDEGMHKSRHELYWDSRRGRRRMRVGIRVRTMATNPRPTGFRAPKRTFGIQHVRVECVSKNPPSVERRANSRGLPVEVVGITHRSSGGVERRVILRLRTGVRTHSCLSRGEPCEPGGRGKFDFRGPSKMVPKI